MSVTNSIDDDYCHWFFVVSSSELLRKPILDAEPDAVRKLKTFYQTCVSAGNMLVFRHCSSID
jgi:hypothetical protein